MVRMPCNEANTNMTKNIFFHSNADGDEKLIWYSVSGFLPIL